MEFKIAINATKEKVWEVLWEDQTYREWAAVFCEGTYALSTWEEGDPIHFLNPEGMGMNSVIFKKEDNEYMAFKHLSEIKDHIVLPVGESSEGWSGGMETYRLVSIDIGTLLEATIDTVDKYVDFFQDVFPKALEKVKELSEKK
ncbi:SRPBCC domain-containing protein [Flavobacterium sp.]|uniref:SRPBCC domain-containing protein n=1 Tax=Flavobacterium sp. TaxID=239 RepID=UPI002C581682|nr:SRPBCC domain-containing protein [Flavobacterium sp.]HSD08807.1 hypothetical protein [Flavobacterium sp.]